MNRADSPLPEGVEGNWLRNGAAEVFLSAKPYPRVLVFRRGDQVVPLRIAKDDQFVGLRTWYMEPEQTKRSLLPALQPAQVTELGALGVRLTARPEPTCGLQLILEARLDADRPVLTVRHGFKNLRDETRRLAAWALLAFPHEGVGLVPWARQKGWRYRTLQYFGRTDPTEPAILVGRRGTGIDYRTPVRAHSVKTGTNSDAGWAAYLWPGGTLLSQVAHVPDGEYPEGGATTTFYSTGGSAPRGLCEVEHVGPFDDVGPGEVLWMEQTLTLLPEPRLSGDDPDVWLDELEQTVARDTRTPDEPQ
jgi:hypothetical protein